MLYVSALYILLSVWLWVTNSLFPNQISRNNLARQEAERAYRRGQFGGALTRYEGLIRNTDLFDPAVRLNLGHTYFQLGRYVKAKPQYQELMTTKSADLRTVAATQLGVIACFERDSATALRLFERALLENPDNEPARRNFELIKQWYSGKPRRSNSPKSETRRPKQNTESQPDGSGRVERSERQDELLRRFRVLNISEEQALQLLDAMQQDDLPYALTQQARRTRNKPAPGGNGW